MLRCFTGLAGFALAGLALASLALVSTAHAGEITRAAGENFAWTSTECERPVRPFIREGDPERQDLMMDYALQTELFIDCMRREAQRDFDRAQREMQDAVQDALQAETERLDRAMIEVVRESR